MAFNKWDASSDDEFGPESSEQLNRELIPELSPHQDDDEGEGEDSPSRLLQPPSHEAAFRKKTNSCVHLSDTEKPLMLHDSEEQRESREIMFSRASGSRSTPGIGEQRSVRSIHSLEDLTDRLIHAGVFEDYCRWRDNYMQWRRGSPTGARGELVNREVRSVADFTNCGDFSREPEELFSLYFPTFKSFMFKRTLAYWVGCFFLEGSLLFFVSSVFLIDERFTPLFPITVTVIPNVLGSILFAFGSYFGFVQHLNEDSTLERKWFAWPHERPMCCGFLGWQAYFYGATLFLIGQLCLAFMGLETRLGLRVLVWIPMTLGGTCFTIGSLCEIIENCNEHFQSLVVWASWISMIGSFSFFIGSAVPLIDPLSKKLLLYGSTWPFMIGVLAFTIDGILTLFMWKKDMFGLTLSRRLNQLSMAHMQPLSTNTILVNIVYIFSAVLSMVNFCMVIEIAGPRFCEMLNSFIIILQVHFFLVLTSSITILPKKQPFRGIMIGVRFLSILLVINVVALFAGHIGDWVRNKPNPSVALPPAQPSLV